MLFLYKTSLDLIYKYYVSDIYEYIDFNYHFDELYYFLSLIILIVYSYLYMKVEEKKTASSLIFIILFLLYFFPNLTYITFCQNIYFFLYSTCYTILLTTIYLVAPSINLYKLISDKYSILVFDILLYGIVLVMLIFVVYYNGFKIKFDFDDVYEIRGKMHDLRYPTILNYLKPISSMFVTAGAMFYLINGKKILASLFIVFGLMLYAFGAHKTDFILIILTVLLYLFYKDIVKKYLSIVLLIFNSLILFILQFSTVELQIVTIGMYLRTFFVPTLLGYYHFDYYNSHDFLFLKEHFSHWFDSSALHTKNSPYIIADYYFGDPNMSSNTGLIGSDYAQFGYFSLIIMLLLRVFVFKIYDEVCSSLNPKMLIISSFTFGFLFINGAFFTSLLSGGFLIMCLLFYLMPRFSS